MSDAHLDECPECEGKVQRLISKGGGILFKGTGFYATDYRSGSPPSETKKSETSKAKNTSSDKSGNGTKKE